LGSSAKDFQLLLFDKFSQSFVTLEHQSEVVDLIEKIVKDFLEE